MNVNSEFAARVREMRIKGDPVLTDSLLALPEEVEHRAHYAPQRALKGLADLLHSHAEATLQARRHGGTDCLDAFVSAEPGDLAYLLQVIAQQMEGMADLPLVDTALALRSVYSRLDEGKQREI